MGRTVVTGQSCGSEAPPGFELGQWPWSRGLISCVLVTLSEAVESGCHRHARAFDLGAEKEPDLCRSSCPRRPGGLGHLSPTQGLPLTLHSFDFYFEESSTHTY
jgi:hypothetical protein